MNIAKYKNPIVLTGAHSGIGQLLIKELISEKIRVFGIVSPWGITDDLELCDDLVEYVKIDLSKTIPEKFMKLFQDTELLVHFAWARPNNSFKAIAANKEIFENLSTLLNDKSKIIFMSSVCATPINLSNYGKAKYHISQFIKEYQCVEIITGLLISKPAIGPFELLNKFIKKFHIKFLFIQSPLCLVSSIDQVMDVTMNAILRFNNSNAIFKAYDPQPVPLNVIINNILKCKNIISIPLLIPTKLTLNFLCIARSLLPGFRIIDRLITLLSVSPKDLKIRLKTEIA